MDKEWDGGWSNMRQDAEAICKQVKKRFWGLGSNAMYGIHYDDTADILFDIHQCIRHQLWIDGGRKGIGVDSDEPMRFGSEPLAKIERIENKSYEKGKRDAFEKMVEIVRSVRVDGEHGDFAVGLLNMMKEELK